MKNIQLHQEAGSEDLYFKLADIAGLVDVSQIEFYSVDASDGAIILKFYDKDMEPLSKKLTELSE